MILITLTEPSVPNAYNADVTVHVVTSLLYQTNNIVSSSAETIVFKFYHRVGDPVRTIHIIYIYVRVPSAARYVV